MITSHERKRAVLLIVLWLAAAILAGILTGTSLIVKVSARDQAEISSYYPADVSHYEAEEYKALRQAAVDSRLGLVNID